MVKNLLNIKLLLLHTVLFGFKKYNYPKTEWMKSLPSEVNNEKIAGIQGIAQTQHNQTRIVKKACTSMPFFKKNKMKLNGQCSRSFGV